MILQLLFILSIMVTTHAMNLHWNREKNFKNTLQKIERRKQLDSTFVEVLKRLDADTTAFVNPVK